VKTRILKPLLFAAPALVSYLLLWGIPIVISIVMCFFKVSGFGLDWSFVGLDNFRYILRDPFFRKGFTNNITWMALSVLFPTVIGLALALMVNTKMRLKNLFRGIFYYPCILSMVSVGLIWRWIFHPDGIFVALQRGLGIAKPLVMLGNMNTALFGIFIAGAWAGIGTGMLLFLAGLQGIPEEIYEAATVDGANYMQKLIRITIPMLRQTFIIVITMALIHSIGVFDVVMATTRGGPGTATYMLAIYMYLNSFRSMYLGIGAAVAWVMMLLVAIPVIPYVMIMQRIDSDS